jgi:hypothetical protein
MQFHVAIADFALEGAAMLTQALHLVMTSDTKDLFFEGTRPLDT